MSTDRSRALTGILIIILGIILLLNSLDYTNIRVWQYWPLLLIVWGLNSLFSGSRSFGSITVSALVAALGFILLGNNLKLFAIRLEWVFDIFWPLLIIIVGLSIFLGQSIPGKTNWAVLGGIERGKSESWELTTGSYIAFMGGVDLDLRNTVIPDGETVLDLTAIMGGIDVKVPAGVNVITDGFAVLGGIEVMGRSSGGIIGSLRSEHTAENGAKTLKIQARAVMGGIDVKRA